MQIIFSKIKNVAMVHKDQERYHAFYAIPVLIGFIVTYLLIQIMVYFFPDIGFSAGGYHIHHYTYGVALILIFGYVGLWVRSEKMKIASAVAHGVGAAFIIDEAFMLFALSAEPGYQDYNLAIIVAALLLGIALIPLFLEADKS